MEVANSAKIKPMRKIPDILYINSTMNYNRITTGGWIHIYIFLFQCPLRINVPTFGMRVCDP